LRRVATAFRSEPDRVCNAYSRDVATGVSGWGASYVAQPETVQVHFSHHVGGDRRGDEKEERDQQFMAAPRPLLKPGDQDRADQYPSDTQSRRLGRTVQPLHQRGQAHQPPASDQREGRAQHDHERSHEFGDGCQPAHSTMSPRRMNLQ
jgi:ABC-type nickel/cobalt efflux system permease component RcnA